MVGTEDGGVAREGGVETAEDEFFDKSAVEISSDTVYWEAAAYLRDIAALCRLVDIRHGGSSV
jgi:hypothetical protein